MRRNFSRPFFTLIAALAFVLTLTQCSQLQSDCKALATRRAEIAQEQPGDYYIGRRYHVPTTRFWGYLRRPGEGWDKARLVIMDESAPRTPDRGVEAPVSGATFGKDNNVEYILHGSFVGRDCYEPNSDQVLQLFHLTGYEVRNRQPGFLFVPSEKYDTKEMTLRPALIPSPSQCSGL